LAWCSSGLEIVANITQKEENTSYSDTCAYQGTGNSLAIVWLLGKKHDKLLSAERGKTLGFDCILFGQKKQFTSQPVIMRLNVAFTLNSGA
jgi:hypothetical protein